MDSPRRLLSGPVGLEAASIAVDGTLVVAAVSIQSNHWSLPINGQALKALGEPQPLTRDPAFSAPVEPLLPHLLREVIALCEARWLLLKNVVVGLQR